MGYRDNNKIIFKIRREDKERFIEASRQLSLSLAGFVRMASAEKANKILKENLEVAE